MEDYIEGILNSFQNTQRSHEQMDEYLSKLQAEPCCQVPEIGDNVIVPAGMLGRGFLWRRIECKVTNITGTSVKIRHTGPSEHDIWEEWIDPILILDVIGKN